jgi:hypothetical protein
MSTVASHGTQTKNILPQMRPIRTSKLSPLAQSSGVPLRARRDSSRTWKRDVKIEH